jgi:hypothetical protein
MKVDKIPKFHNKLKEADAAVQKKKIQDQVLKEAREYNLSKYFKY